MQGKVYSKTILKNSFEVEARIVPTALYYLVNSGINVHALATPRVLDSIKSNMKTNYGLQIQLTAKYVGDTLSPTDYKNDLIYEEVFLGREYHQTLNRFRTGMIEVVWLEINGTKFSPRSIHYNESWGMTKSSSWSIVFDSLQAYLPKKRGEVTLVVDDLKSGFGRYKFSWQLPNNSNDFL